MPMLQVCHNQLPNILLFLLVFGLYNFVMFTLVFLLSLTYFQNFLALFLTLSQIFFFSRFLMVCRVKRCIWLLILRCLLSGQLSIKRPRLLQILKENQVALLKNRKIANLEGLQVLHYCYLWFQGYFLLKFTVLE